MSHTAAELPGTDDGAARGTARPILLIPVYNDWQSLRLLLPLIDAELAKRGARADVLVVNDASTILPPSLEDLTLYAIRRVEMLSLRRNVGHQRAIAIGLCHLASTRVDRTIVVMDADGEDRPSDVLRLIDASMQSGTIAFAKRTRRSEGLLFSLFYHLYRAAHRVLVGFGVEVGNFSAMPFSVAQQLVVVSEVWNHYAAGVVRAKLPRELVPTERGPRLAGQSHMDFPGLVSHGLSAMSVFADRIGVRLLAATGVLMALLVVGIIATLAVRFFTHLAIPGWATVATGVLLILLAQAALLSLVFAFMIQFARTGLSHLPIRDYEPFVASLDCLYARDG
jgi:hypothetical protein